MRAKDLKQINKILQDHERRLTLIEKGKVDVKVKSSKKSLSKHIIELRDQGSFKEPIIPKEIYKKLTAVYQCDFNRVEVALGRLLKSRKLRKTSKLINGKKYIAYVW